MDNEEQKPEGGLTEAQRLRRARFKQIGELPDSYGTFTIIVAPDRTTTFQAEHLALWEILGILTEAMEHTKLQLQSAIFAAAEQRTAQEDMSEFKM